MSSISTDGGFQYYQKAVDNLESDYETREQRRRERDSAREAKAEQNLEETVRELNEDTERTIQKVRDEANDAMSRSRENARSEVERIKAQSYDRSGRYNGEDADTVKHSFKAAQKGWEEQEASLKKALQESDDYRTRLVTENDAENAAKLENTLIASRMASNSAVEANTEKQNNAYHVLQDESRKQRIDLQKRHQNDLNDQKHVLEKAHNDAQREYNHNLKRFAEVSSARNEEQRRQNDKKAERQIEIAKDAYTQEAKKLKEQVKDVVTARDEYVKNRSDATSEVIRAYENEWKMNEKALTEDYEKSLRLIKQRSEEATDHVAVRNAETLKEKDTFYADQFKKQNIDSFKQRKEEQELHETQLKNFDKQLSRERLQAQQQLESELSRSYQDREKALQYQAKAYQDTLAQTKADQNDQLALINREASSKAENDVSNFHVLEKQYQKEGEKVAIAAHERQKAAVDSIQQEYADRVNDVILDKDSKHATLLREKQTENYQERSALLQYLREAQLQLDTALRDQEQNHVREKETLSRNLTAMMNRQRRQYEEMLQSQRTDSSSKVQTVRQDADFELKMAQKQFATKQNEMVRDYQKKLADQKTEYDSIIQDLKAGNEMALRDADKRTKQSLEEQARSYEQRIAQLEIQHQERERMNTQNYQEEIERMRRSSSMINKRKA